MSVRRRGFEPISIAFLDVITCGFGAIILLLMIARFGEPPAPEPVDDPRGARIATLSRELFALRRETRELAASAARHAERLAALEDETARLRTEATRLKERASAAAATAAREAQTLGALETAQQALSDEMRRLYRQRDRIRTDLVGGIPIDSEYIIFIIDTSASMYHHAWERVIDQIVQTLKVYPRVKGIQIMNDMGAYMFAEHRGRWIADSPAWRNAIVERLRTWNAFSNSSPVEGIEAAIKTFYSPDRKISLYVYGDEFTGASIRKVVERVRAINRPGADGKPLVRIHAIGFPVQFANAPALQETGIRFATLMRALTRENGGTFVGLDAFR